MTKEEKQKLTREFKETEYGKKSYAVYIICGIISTIFIAGQIVFNFIMSEKPNFVEEYNYITIAIIGITCYYEGIYSGALKQYQLTHGKKSK